MVRRDVRVALLAAGILAAGAVGATDLSTPAEAVEQEITPLQCGALPGASQVVLSAANDAGGARRDGWHFAIADDTSPPGIEPALGERFARLRPKTFRIQVQWDAAYRPDHIDRARDLICKARAQGVQQIVVTFRGDFTRYYQPRPANEYRPAVSRFVQLFRKLVHVWGPANEPNLNWLPGTQGAKKLAKYYRQLKAVQERYDPKAQLLSPEFHDYGSENKKKLNSYIKAYVRAGGGFGDIIGWHPYAGLNRRPEPSTSSTVDLLDLLNQYSNARSQNVWITEVGAFGPWHNTNKKESLKAQNKRVKWLIDSRRGFLKFHRITRIYYYNMRAVEGDAWDSGLTSATPGADPDPRPAWRTWCAASHGDNARHPDCLN